MKPILISFSKDSDREELEEALEELQGARVASSHAKLDLTLDEEELDRLEIQKKQIQAIYNLLIALVAVKDAEDALRNDSLLAEEGEPPIEIILEAMKMKKEKESAKYFAKNITNKYFKKK